MLFVYFCKMCLFKYLFLEKIILNHSLKTLSKNPNQLNKKNEETS